MTFKEAFRAVDSVRINPGVELSHLMGKDRRNLPGSIRVLAWLRDYLDAFADDPDHEVLGQCLLYVFEAADAADMTFDDLVKSAIACKIINEENDDE